MTDAPKPQADKFRELARELECDEDEAAFEDKVRRVATATAGDPDNPEWTAEDFRRAKDKVRKVATTPKPEPGPKE